MVDNIPVGSYASVPGSEDKVFSRGFPVGFTTPSSKGNGALQHNLNNHLRIIVKFHDDEEDMVESGRDAGTGEPTTKIVGFRVEALSVKHAYSGDNFVAGQTTVNTCPGGDSDGRAYQTVDRAADNTVVFTYDVAWERSAVEWSARWDVYLNSSSPNEKVRAREKAYSSH